MLSFAKIQRKRDASLSREWRRHNFRFLLRICEVAATGGGNRERWEARRVVSLPGVEQVRLPAARALVQARHASDNAYETHWPRISCGLIRRFSRSTIRTKFR